MSAASKENPISAASFREWMRTLKPARPAPHQDPELNKSAGRIQILGGDIYYSPNCQRDVHLPPPHVWGSNPFSPPSEPNQKRNVWQLDTSAYEQPRWWNDHHGWIAFYDKYVLDTRSTLLRILNFSTAFEEDVGYTLPRCQADEWLTLDKQLESACIELIAHYHFIPALCPMSPWAFGYLNPHRKRGTMSLCLQKSREWFGVWFGLLSYVIAQAESKEVEVVKDRFLAKQKWKDRLVAKCSSVYIDPAWIDLLLDTNVATFSPYVSRTGTFLSITGSTSELENSFQPRVEWFVEYGVPVWYRWDKYGATLPRNQYLAPLEYQLQEADSFIRKSPSLPAPNVKTMPFLIGDSVVGFVVDNRPSFSTVQMDNFFKLREERTARLKESETPQQRILRLSREGQPPTVNARVFEWTPNNDGEFVYEEITSKRRRREILEDYRGNQRRYNAILNEWHLCVHWDQFEDPDDDDDYFSPQFEGDDNPPDSPNQLDFCANDDTILDGDIWTQDEQGSSDRAVRLQQEIIHVATLYFGYTPRIPLPAVATPILKTEQQRKKFCREFGLIWDQVVPVQEVLDYPAIVAVIDFYYRLARNAKMLPGEWDLSQDNHQSVAHSSRFKLFRPVYSTETKKLSDDTEVPSVTLYMLELGSTAITSWRVAVKSASDALMICRLDSTFNEYHIVDFLLTNGIPFHTLQPSRAVLRTPNIPRPCLTPLARGEEYKFGSQDYHAYREHCHTILNHPRGRAALMHGHFMWRIANRSVLWEAVYRGPSGWSANIDEMVVVRDPYTDMEYIDDKLSSAEQEALCGTYHCLTGHGKQPAIKSWYMPPHIYEKSALDLGRWSTLTESSLFALLDRTFVDQTRYPTIKRGPLPRGDWHNRARSTVEIKKARGRLELTAGKLFEFI